MRSVYTVRQINAYIKNMFSQDFLLRTVTVKGEVSNCKDHPSGHLFFTLKDESGTLSCVMFAGNRKNLRFVPESGMQVQVSGTIDVFERDGRYQLYAKSIERDGAGALFEQFERLKKRLSESGMFSAEYKQPIPRYIRTLGVVTAESGAAVRDIIHIARRRNPYVRILLYPAIVQGEHAAGSIVRGIEALAAYPVDVMIVGRGGGSIEDLWAFNDERVAEAIFNCPVPVISAVGHETDVTIADFVADLRAPTPSAAAELAVYEYARFRQDTAAYADTLTRLMTRLLERSRNRLSSGMRSLAILSPESRLRTLRAQTVQYDDRLRALMLTAVERSKRRLAEDDERLRGRMTETLSENRHRLALHIAQLQGLSPLERLNRGYAYLTDAANGESIRSVTQTAKGRRLIARLKDGEIDAVVTAVRQGRMDAPKEEAL